MLCALKKANFFKKFFKNLLTNGKKCGIISYVGKREWRNWQTRTFEGRVVTPYGFKSRFSHQKMLTSWVSIFHTYGFYLKLDGGNSEEDYSNCNFAYFVFGSVCMRIVD